MTAPLLHHAAAPSADGALADGGHSAALCARLDGWITSRDAAGLQYLVMHEGKALIEHCAGVADAASGQPVSCETLFNLYSITKPLTAAVVTRLALQGAFDLDEPIARTTGLAGLQGFGTVRETLLHRAGFANPMPLRWFHRADDDARFDERAFVQKRLADAARRGRSSPRYSNIGYLALGRAVEHATGLGFRQAFQVHLINSLQLGPAQRLGFTPGAGDPWALGHLRKHSLLNLVLGALVPRHDIVAGTAGPWVQLYPHQVDGSAYGGLIGNARGLAQFGMALLGQGVGIEEALRSQVCSVGPGHSDAHTLAWFTGQLAGQPWLGHAGGGLGAYGELRLYPNIGAVSVLLTNRPGLRDSRTLDGLDGFWLAAASGR